MRQRLRIAVQVINRWPKLSFGAISIERVRIEPVYGTLHIWHLVNSLNS